MGVLMKHINEPPAPVEGLPPAIQYVLDRALAKDVDDRYQTPAEFGEAFLNAVEHRADFSTLDVLSPKAPTRKAAKKLFNRSRRPRWVLPALVGLGVTIAAAAIFFSGALPLGTGATGTPTLTLTGTNAIPSVSASPVTMTDTPIPAILLGRTGVLQFEDSDAVANQAKLVATALLAPPPGNQYEVWLVEGEQRLSLGILALDESGRGELIFTDQQQLNLVANYSGMEVTVEPDPDTDANTSGLVAYSFTHAPEGLTHLRSILASFPNTPRQNALIQGLYTNVQTMNELSQEMQKASANGNVDRVRLHAEAILNILVGNGSTLRKDWNSDGQVDDPSDGYGMILNGRNLGYLQATFIEAEAAANSAGASQEMVAGGTGLKNSTQNLAQWTGRLQELMTAILTVPAPDDLDQKVDEAAALTARMLNGFDQDEDGIVEALLGEAGAQVAYEQAYRMADMPLEAVGILNMGTGTPTFVLVTPTKTSGGGSGSGSTGATQPPPPGQQKTPRPTNDNKPPEKTKKPTGNNSTSSDTTTNNANNGNKDSK